MSKLYSIIGGSIIIFTLYSCRWFDEPYQPVTGDSGIITLVNQSEDTLYYDILDSRMVSNGDTAIMFGPYVLKPNIPIRINAKYEIALYGFWYWDEYLIALEEKYSNSFVLIRLFNKQIVDILNSAEPDMFSEKHLVYQERFDLEDLQRKNWTIVYPLKMVE